MGSKLHPSRMNSSWLGEENSQENLLGQSFNKQTDTIGPNWTLNSKGKI